MTSVCISSCVNDARVPVRATYVNLYKWPESDAEFIKSVGSNRHPRVVDSISCRQMYLRSYTFSKKETVPEKTMKCFGRVKERVAAHGSGGAGRDKGGGVGGGGGGGGGGGHGKRFVVVSKVKEISCTALYAIFRRLLSCTSTVDVVDSRDQKYCESL